MSRREEEAIVLDAELAGEADRRLLLLTQNGEAVRAVAPAAARSRRRYGAALQPGARIMARWTQRGEGRPALLDEAQLLAAPPVPDPLERYYAAAHALELAAGFAREGDQDPRLFRLVAVVLERLAGGDPEVPLLRYLEAWVLRLAGLLPEFDACEECGAPLTGRTVGVVHERGAFCGAHAPGGAWTLGTAGLEWLNAIRRCPPGALPPLAGRAAEELGRLLPALIGAFIERPMRALAALRRLERAGNGA